MVGKSLPVRNAIKSTGMYLGRIITLRLEDLFSDRIQACERPSVLGPGLQSHLLGINL